MLNSGRRGRRAQDGYGILSVNEKFNQENYPIPIINSYAVTDGSYNPQIDQALDTAGGQTVVIYGSGFKSGATVSLNGSNIGVVTLLDQGRLAITSPELSSGSYTIYVSNSNGATAIYVPGLVYSGKPTWSTTAGSIGSFYETKPASQSFEATGDTPLSYSIVSGSLPSGTTLSSEGSLSGTLPADSGSTTYSFTIRATDPELQTSDRSFSLTVNTDVVTWVTPSPNFVITGYEYGSVTSTISATDAAGYGILYSANTLPAGITLDANTGVISGSNNLVANTETRLTATANTTNRFATRDGVISIAQDVVTWSTPTDQTTYTLSGGTAISNVALAATTASGQTVSFSANTLPTGLSLSGNTIYGTPSDGVTTYTLLTATSANSNRTATRNIIWTVLVGDTYWKTTTLGLNAVPLSTPFNNDASNNNAQISVFADAKPNNFNPYEEGYYSNYFDGSGDSLDTTSTTTQLTFGNTTNFTIEAWVYPLGYNQSGNGPPDKGTIWSVSVAEGGNARPVFGINSTGKLVFGGWNTITATGSTTIPLNKWSHVAVTFDGTTYKLFYNGALDGTSTTILNFSTATLTATVGSNPDTTYRYPYYGYISNVRVLRGTALYTAAFTPPTEPLKAIANTVMLTCQSNKFIDNSTNNFALTRTGDVKVTPAQPFSTPTTAAYNTQYSAYFDGTGDYLTLPSSNQFTFGTGSFTIEAWVNTSSNAASYAQWVFSNISTASGNAQIGLSLNPSGNLLLQTWNTVILTSSITVPLKTWTHVAASFDGTSYRLFIDGIVRATGTTLYTLSTDGGGNIGYGGQAGNSLFTGYISNLRVVKGTAVYTENFTPSTSPLTAIAGTSLLTCQDSTLKDNSTNNFAITSVADAKPIAVSPFTMTTANSTVTDLGSAHFDGTGDKLTIPANAALGMGSGDFTIEFWMYQTALSDYKQILDIEDGNSVGRLILWVDGGGTLINLGQNGGSRNSTAGGAIKINTWTHVVLTRASGTTRFYINGTQSGSNYSDTTNYTCTTGTVFIGTNSDGSTYPYQGYLANLRMVKGTALYTANFLPPQVPATAVANTQLLTFQTNGGATNNGFVDQSDFNNIVTRVGNATQGTFSPYSPNGWSTYYNGTSDYQYVPTNAAFAIGTADFTVECWVMPIGANLAWGTIFAGVSFGSSSDWGLYSGDSTTSLYPTFYFTSTGTPGSGTNQTQGNQTLTGYTKLTIGQWNHIAVSRASGTARMFLNGTQTGPSRDASTWSLTNVLQKCIAGGWNGNSNTLFSGYISNLRVVSGTGLYTNTFEPSTSSLTAIPGTILLTNQNNRFIDNSPYNFTLTSGGTPSIQAMTPFNGVNSPASYSAYMDGTGYVISPVSGTANVSPVFGLGKEDYTVELWTWLNNDTSIGIWDFRNQGGGSGLARPNLIYTGGNSILFSIGGTAKITYNVTLTQYTWHHFAVSRISGVTTLYVNGVARGTYSGTEDFGSTNTFTVGTVGDSPGYATTELTGYVSNVRVVRGIGVYTGEFTVPTSPLQITQSAGTNIAAIGTIPTNGNSVHFDGTGDYLSTPNKSAFSIGTGDVTIEGWLYVREWKIGGIVSCDYAANFHVQTAPTSSAGVLYFWVAGASIYVTLANAPALNTWFHFACVRESGGAAKIYINGVAQATGTLSGNGSTSAALYVGASSHSLSENFSGYMSNVRFVKGTAIVPPSGGPTSPLTAVANTSLLTCQSSTLQDNSTNGFPLTVNGNATVAKSWSPFGYNTSYLGFQSADAKDISVNSVPQINYGNVYPRAVNPFGVNGVTSTTGVSYSPVAHSGSMYFDGTGDYLTMPSTTSFRFNNDFTIEAWVYPKAYSTNNGIICQWTSDLGFIFKVVSGNRLYFAAYPGSQVTIQATSTTVDLNRWNHVAVTRSGSTIRLFVNGVQDSTTGTNSGTYYAATDPVTVGSLGAAEYWNGYISDVRIIKGTALYNSNFYPRTVPATPTGTIGGTPYNSNLLLNGTSGAIIDARTVSDVETVGTTLMAPEDPYAGNYYSYAFDGTTNGRIALSSAATIGNIGTGDFTVECWVYLNTTSSSRNILSKFFSLTSTLYYNGTNFEWYNKNAFGPVQPVAGRWYHVAAVRSSGVITVYMDGVPGTPVASTDNYTGSSGPFIGSYTTNTELLNGYISNLRATNTAVYTSAFTPPTGPLTAISGTLLLTCQSNKFVDNGPNAMTLTPGTTSKVQSINPFQQNTGKSMYFGTKTDYLSMRSDATLTRLTTDFTIECWVNPTDVSLTTMWGILDARTAGSSATAWFLGLSNYSSGWLMSFYNGGFSYGTTRVRAGEWTHLAWVRVGSVMTFYVNGQAGGTAVISTSSTTLATTTTVYVGSKDNGLTAYGTVGYIKDLRITNGNARYTENFTPPNQTFVTKPG